MSLREHLKLKVVDILVTVYFFQPLHILSFMLLTHQLIDYVLKLPKWLWLQKEADESEICGAVWTEFAQISEAIGERWWV